MHLDIARLRADCKDIESQIRETKTPLRRPWTRPMGGLQYRLLTLKARATDLYILGAHARGRVHLASDPERCFEVAAKLAPGYAKEVAA